MRLLLLLNLLLVLSFSTQAQTVALSPPGGSSSPALSLAKGSAPIAAAGGLTSVNPPVTSNRANANGAPVIAPQTFSLAENSANGTVVGTAAASDPDAGQTLTYALTAGNTSGAFAINSSTGQLIVANTAALDFETTPSFALTVQATDNGSPVLSASNTITVNLTDLPNAAYVSSTTEQNTRGVVAGSTNQVILRIPVVLNGNTDQPLSVRAFAFSITGTTTPADVKTARFYYTGTSDSFAATTLFGSVPTPGTGAIVLSGSQVLQPNTNYFWLVYDVAATAATGNVLDARVSFLNVGGTSYTPTVTAPAGGRTVVDPSDVAGTALRFSGTAAGYVDLGTSNPNLVLGQQYTLEVWVKPAGGSGTVLNGLLGNSSGTAGQVAPYLAIAANNQVETGYGNGSSTVTASTGTNATTSGQWNQLVATFDGNALSLYVNGILLSQTIGFGASANTAVRYLGTLTPSASTFFTGDVDEVALWTRALTQDEIRLRRHLVLGGSENGLTSYVQFNEASGNVQDIISGASGPLTGAGVARATSTAPVAAGVSSLQTVSGSGNVAFTGTGVAINFTGSGTYAVGVARLSGKPRGTQPSGLVRYYNEAYWVLNKYDAGTFSNAAVTYTLRPVTLSTIDATNPNATLRLLRRDSKSDGAFGPPISATAANQAAGTVTFNLTSFSQTVVGTLGTSPLPVELTSFTVEARNADALLRWATASEKNNDHFEVEASADGRTFQRIGKVAGHGSSTQAHEYQFVDPAIARYAASTVYYRLRQVDADGTASYSPVRTVALTGAAAGLNLYPNPAHGGAATLTGAQPGTAVTVFDSLGRPVTTTTANVSGEAALPAGLPTGVYVVRVGSKAVRLTVE